MIKNCVFCKHYYFSCAGADYGAHTPGYDAEIGCGKDVWALDLDGDSDDTYQTYMRTAESCEFYEVRAGYEKADEA